MTTATRLSLFFLAALTVVLLGFSCTVYALAYWRLHAQLDSEMEAALHVLVASIEVHPNDVEWEPLERDVRLGRKADIDEVRWTIRDENGVLIDHSANLTSEDAFDFPTDATNWRVDRRQMSAGKFEPLLVEAADIPNADLGDGALGSDRTAVRQQFFIVVAAAEAPVHEALSQLAMALTGVSITVLAVCAALGRWLCRQALRPIARMANEARAIHGSSETTEMLAIPPTGDELTDLAVSFNSLLADLRQQIENQQRFAGDASHQLRTPLTAMLTAVDVTARHERSAEEYRRTLDVVAKRGRELEQIINTLLMLARGEDATEMIPQEKLPLIPWVKEQIERWSSHSQTTDIRLVSAEEQVSVITRPALLAQVFDNVLDNACKYSEPGTAVLVDVTTALVQSPALPDQSEATIAVTNRGFGISFQDLTKVFQPFFRSEQARWSGVAGVGLGLTISQRLIQLLQGRIEVESRADGETRFSIVIDCEPNRPSTASVSLEAAKTIKPVATA